MDLRKCRRIVIYGGTFDPPHAAHVTLPMLAARLLKADAVAYVPAHLSPHKSVQPTSAKHRLAMLHLALRDQPWAQIVTDEIDRASRADGRPSYTVDTLEELRDRLGPGVEMRLLIGTDQALAFDRWRESQRVITLAEPAVMVRPPETRTSVLASLDDPDEWRDRLLDLPLMPISATEIRERIAHGESTEGLLDPLVRDYIDQHHLYRDGI